MSSSLTPPPTPPEPRSIVIATLRWIAVLPAAVGAFFAIQLLIIVADATMAEGRSVWYLQLVNSFASAYVFVFAGAHTAPKYQFKVGVVLAVLLVIFIVGVIALASGIKTTEPLWWLVLTSAASIAAALGAVVQLKEEGWQLK